jgi:uncharacterized iron-regulated protein
MGFFSSHYEYLHKVLLRDGIISSCLFAIIILFFSLPVYATPVYDRIMQVIAPDTITIVGETHQRVESVNLFQSLIDDYLQQNNCLIVALEIASNQQSIIDDVVRGKAAVSAIEIAPIIDHPPFRALIDSLVRMRSNGACLELAAIDAGIKEKTGRDEWTAAELAEQVSQYPVLALLGNLHALKKIDWDMAMTNESPYVAEILISQGYRINSFAQIWTDSDCDRHSRIVSADEPEATDMINSRLVALLNAFETKRASDTIDGIILWECE